MATSKTKETLDTEQHELIENAQARIKQKKRLYLHFVIFLVGSIFLIVINKILKFGVEYDWFVWAILFWAFLFVVHLINVFVTNRMFSKKWERKQRERLVARQQGKIAALQRKIDKEMPLPEEEIMLPEKKEQEQNKDSE